MHRWCRILALLVIGILGIQSGAGAVHAHLLPMAAVHGSSHLAHDEPANNDGKLPAGHHSASCASAQSCFPTAFAAAIITVPAVMQSITPVPLRLAALPSPRPDRLLRPPRLPG